MISEGDFCRRFSSFWNELAPLGSNFVRSINLKFIESYGPPIDSVVTPSRRAIVNETAARTFYYSTVQGLAVSDVIKARAKFKVIENAARNTIARLPRSTKWRVRKLVEREVAEAELISKNIEHYFGVYERGKGLVVDPVFKGCGLLDESQGDIICSDTLYELKAGDRTFRLLDFRQLLVYLALNYASRQYDIASICLLNPRHSTYVKISVEDMCMQLIGRSTVDVLAEIVQFISSAEVSR